MMYRPKLNFVRANQVKRKMKVETADGPTIAEAGDYVVIYPGEQRTVLKKVFFEYTYESAEDVVFCDVCVDFDGVVNSYVSGWQGAGIVSDPPVEGAIDALRRYVSAKLSVAIHSARSAQADGIQTMYSYIDQHDTADRNPFNPPLVDSLLFPVHKPAARYITIDDHGVPFDGTFPSVEDIRSFRVWNESDKTRKRILEVK